MTTGVSDSRLSWHADQLLKRIKQGKFYRPFTGRVPKAMQELIDLNLVTTVGRVTTVEVAYVPTENYTPFVPEKFENDS